MYHNLLWTEGRAVLLACLFFLVLFVLLSFVAQNRQYRVLQYVSSFLAYSVLLLLCASFYFFRNPDRTCSEALIDPQVLVCPADGHVVEIVQGDAVDLGFNTRVSIFLSPLDVHVNWTPMAGVISEIVYKPGRFIAAFVPKSSELNERLDMRIKQGEKEILVRQIAGTLARRISCWVKTGQQVTLGQKYGMIRFGSRVDILLPKAVVIAVQRNQKVYGGQTPLGRWV